MTENMMAAKSSKKAQPVPTDNFLAYTQLSDDDWQIFISAHLHAYLNVAYDRLFSKKAAKKKPLTGAHQIPLYSAEELDYINSRIKYALELIGKYSNERFGASAEQQHAFFQRLPNQETFFTRLFRAVQGQKQYVISGSEKNVPILNDVHLEIEAERNKKKVFPRMDGAYLTEHEIYAAGIFYAMNFVFDAVKMNDAARLGRLFANMFHFGLGTSYVEAYGKKGGKENAKKWNADKEKAYVLFQENNIYKDYGPKHASMASALIPFLPSAGIMVSKDTVEVKWISDFVRRVKK